MEREIRNKLERFVPEAIKRFASQETDAPYSPPMMEKFQAVALFADVSGFTAMTEFLSKRGPTGAEDLKNNLNSYLEQLVRRVVGHGGDVFKFAGDALVVLWTPDEVAERGDVEKMGDEERAAYEKHLEEAQTKEMPKLAHRVVQCCVEIQKEFDKMLLVAARDGEDSQLRLSVKLGVGCGTTYVMHVGGVYHRLEYLACGESLTQAYGCEGDCTDGGQVIVSKDIFKLIGKSFKWDKVKDPKTGKYKNTGNLMVNLDPKRKNVSVTRRRQKRVEMSNELAQRMQHYIPSAVVPHLRMKRSEWAGELRHASVLFVSLDYNLANPKGDQGMLNDVNELIRTVQKCIYHFQGSLNKFLVDDKGSTLIAVFGLPPVAHENDASRAVLAALKLSEDLREMVTEEHPEGFKCACGITTGIVFSGLIGSAGSRREYTVLGDQVNLAARLMSKAKKNWSDAKYMNDWTQAPHIIVDSSVFHAARSEPRLEFHKLKPIKVKGKTVWIEPYVPSYQKIITQAFYPREIQNFKRGDGEHEKRLSAAIGNMKETKRGEVIIIEGIKGMGKSKFLEHYSVRNSHQVLFAWAKADCFTMGEQYPCWKQLLESLFKKFAPSSAEFPRKLREYMRARRPDLYRNIYLGNELLKCHFPDNDQSGIEDLSKAAIDNATHDIVFCFLEMFARTKCLVVVVDECQHLGTMDWTMTRRLCCLVKAGILENISVFLGSQPIHNKCYTPHFPPPQLLQQYKDLRTKFCHQVISPKRWSIKVTEEYIKGNDAFECTHVDPLLLETIQERCGGRPGFIADYVSMLKETQRHLVVWTKGEAVCWVKRVQMDLSDPAKSVYLQIPSKIHSAAASHLDVLSPKQAIVLKTAAVVCIGSGANQTRFQRQYVENSIPIDDVKHNFQECLTDLLSMQFIHRVRKANSPHNLDDGVAATPPVASLLQNPAKMGVLRYTKGGKRSLDKGKDRLFILKQGVLYWCHSRSSNKVLKRVPLLADKVQVSASHGGDPTLMAIDDGRGQKHILRGDETDISEWYDAINKEMCTAVDGTMQDDEDDDPNPEYEFPYGLLRDVVYRQMLFKQRKMIHNLCRTFIQERIGQIKGDTPFPGQMEQIRELDLMFHRHTKLHDGIEEWINYTKDGMDDSPPAKKKFRIPFFGKRGK